MTPKERWNRVSRGTAVDEGHVSDFHCHLVAASGEFVGTFFFLYMAYSGQLMVLNQYPSLAVSGGASSETIVFIALVYALSLLVNAWAFYRISGGLFNPAVALGLGLAGKLDWARILFLIPTQLVASMVAGGLVQAMFGGDISNINTILVSGTSIAQGLFIEMFLTAQLVFVILMLAVEKSKDTFMAPIGIGLALFVAELSVYFTGGSLNPARSFGCAVAGRSFPRYHWIYWLGPALGASLAAIYYRFVKWAHYEKANPGQDSTGTDIEAGKP
ncbi:hypothetical protein N0V93_006487 [Gnomoniopsis smithogilvyi]|uniref:Aquaporin n=1 Tax=Gnomoniopsis smithogilvyi TaxID=1191159 RepID=A0A9W8YS00_9PEZI|nr:hypothetical protein N0V93_006487 [Gnomoniopsis smithogilvyi]